MVLWATNAAGAAELVLVNPFLGPPSDHALDADDPDNRDPLSLYMKTCALVYAWLVFGYTCYVLLLSPFAISFAPLRVAEDVFLVALAFFACYTLVLDDVYYKEGQYLLIYDHGDVKSCKSRFLQFFPIDEWCRDVVATCHEHADKMFRLGDEPRVLVGKITASLVILAFKLVALYYERRIALV